MAYGKLVDSKDEEEKWMNRKKYKAATEDANMAVNACMKN